MDGATPPFLVSFFGPTLLSLARLSYQAFFEYIHTSGRSRARWVLGVFFFLFLLWVLCGYGD